VSGISAYLIIIKVPACTASSAFVHVVTYLATAAATKDPVSPSLRVGTRQAYVC